jgi:ribosomal protein S18 acetylase RimI-like enzyme
MLQTKGSTDKSYFLLCFPPGSLTSFMAQGIITIAPALQEDLEWIAQLLAGTDPWVTLGIGLETCRVAVRDPQLELFVAKMNGVAAGAMIIHPKGLAGAAYLKSIAVAQPWRGQGIGAALLHYAEQQYKSRSRHIFLCVSDFNERARAFYSRQGYTPVGILKDHIMDGKSEHLLVKRLV